MTSSVHSTRSGDAHESALGLAADAEGICDELSPVIDALFQDAKEIDELNRRLLQRIRALQLTINARQRGTMN